MPSVEERMDSLESILGQFIVHTDVALRRLENEMKEFKNEMKEFKDEMKEFKDEMKEFKDEMRAFKDEVREENRMMNKRWGEISNKLGTIVEDIIFPATGPVLEKYFDCDPEIIGMNIKRKSKDRKLKDEFDVIAVCGDNVFLVEVKATPKKEYIDEFINVKIERFRILFDEYREKELIPIFASLRLEEDIVDYLTQNRIYAMAYREWDYMDILNFEELKR